MGLYNFCIYFNGKGPDFKEMSVQACLHFTEISYTDPQTLLSVNGKVDYLWWDCGRKVVLSHLLVSIKKDGWAKES
jgi:hypothetical protein